MNVDEIITKNKLLEEKNTKLEEELQSTKEKCGWFTGYYAVRAVVVSGIETAMVHQTSI